jgi:hypothetical protein
MIDATRFFAILTILIFSGLVMAQQKAPTESQCKDMVTGMLQAMKSAPMKTDRDKKGAQEITDRAEKIVKDNRARGMSECESWAAIGKLVTTQ